MVDLLISKTASKLTGNRDCLRRPRLWHGPKTRRRLKDDGIYATTSRDPLLLEKTRGKASSPACQTPRRAATGPASPSTG